MTLIDKSNVSTLILSQIFAEGFNSRYSVYDRKKQSSRLFVRSYFLMLLLTSKNYKTGVYCY